MQRVKTFRRQAPPAPSMKAAAAGENVGQDSAAGPVVAGLALSARALSQPLIEVGA
jgi:hypothetical protein